MLAAASTSAAGIRRALTAYGMSKEEIAPILAAIAMDESVGERFEWKEER